MSITRSGWDVRKSKPDLQRKPLRKTRADFKWHRSEQGQLAWRVCWIYGDGDDFAVIGLPFATERDAKAAKEVIEKIGPPEAIEKLGSEAVYKAMTECLQW